SRAQLTPSMNAPPVFLGVIADEHHGSPVGFGLLDHLFPDDQVSVFVNVTAVLLGVLIAWRNLFCISILSVLFIGRHLIRRWLRADTPPEKNRQSSHSV